MEIWLLLRRKFPNVIIQATHAVLSVLHRQEIVKRMRSTEVLVRPRVLVCTSAFGMVSMPVCQLLGAYVST